MSNSLPNLQPSLHDANIIVYIVIKIYSIGSAPSRCRKAWLPLLNCESKEWIGFALATGGEANEFGVLHHYMKKFHLVCPVCVRDHEAKSDLWGLKPNRIKRSRLAKFL